MTTIKKTKNILEYCISKDKYNLLDAIFMVGFGSISRKTAVGNVKQLFEVIFPETAAGFGDQMSRYTGYLIQGQMAGSGPAREASRLLNAKQSQVYTERPMTAEETELFEPGFLEKTERYVRNEIAYNLLPGSPFFGGKFKEKDWLGTKIRLSWKEMAHIVVILISI